MLDYSSVIKGIVEAIETNNTQAYNTLRATVIANIGYMRAASLFNQANLQVQSKPYQFPSFDAKVISQNTDKYIVSEIEPSHNED
jgi:hypothetical protein